MWWAWVVGYFVVGAIVAALTRRYTDAFDGFEDEEEPFLAMAALFWPTIALMVLLFCFGWLVRKVSGGA